MNAQFLANSIELEFLRETLNLNRCWFILRQESQLCYFNAIIFLEFEIIHKCFVVKMGWISEFMDKDRKRKKHLDLQRFFYYSIKRNIFQSIHTMNLTLGLNGVDFYFCVARCLRMKQLWFDGVKSLTSRH